MQKFQTSATPRRQSDSGQVTIERVESAIATVVEMMEKHNRPGLIENIRMLEEEIDRLQSVVDPMVEARKILSRVHNKLHNMPGSQAD